MAPLNKLALFVVLAAGLATSAAAANIYKYLDERGRTVFNSNIPPDLVKNGYTIMNERGQVLEVVPRQLTAEEVAAREAVEQARLAQEEAERKQLEDDNLLVRTYTSVEEIMAQRDVRVMRLDSQLIDLTGNLSKTDAEVTRLTQLADKATAEGKTPEAAVTTKLETETAKRVSLQNQIIVVEAEKQEEIAMAERNAQRLGELLGAAEQPAGQ